MSEPYRRKEVIGDATLYLGDCRDVLPTLTRFDAIITDPPYGIGKDGQKRTTGGHGGRKEYAFKGWDFERPEKSVFDLIMASAEHHIIWGGNYFADFLPASSKWLVWDKDQRINQSDGELAYTLLQGALRIFDLNRVSLMMDGAQHPTQKPVELMKWCIDHLPKTIKTICDPFCGSGSTGVAAVKVGKAFTGIERDPEYFEITLDRIRKAYAQPDMFIAPPAEKPKQEAML